MTDVTGFGLLGHLIEMAEGSGLSAEIYYDKIPIAAGVKEYIAQRIFPDATTRNWSSYSDKVKFNKARPDDPVGRGVNVMEAFTLLPDPQTNGGLLVSVMEESLEEVKEVLKNAALDKFIEPVGKMINRQEKIILVQ
jgi:selenide,water dikinase